MMFFEKDWGFMQGMISKYHFDFLPRVSLAVTPHIIEVIVAFLSFRLHFSLFSGAMQEFNRRNR